MSQNGRVQKVRTKKTALVSGGSSVCGLGRTSQLEMAVTSFNVVVMGPYYLTSLFDCIKRSPLLTNHGQRVRSSHHPGT